MQLFCLFAGIILLVNQAKQAEKITGVYMIFFGVILGIGIMAGTVFMALDKKSHLHVRIASIIAIFLMILTIIICLVVAFTDNRVPVDESVLIVGAAPEIQEKSTNVMTLVLLIILLIVMFIVIALLTIHEQRKVSQKKP
jgi:cytochrome bd-type quinol oxidase subunit 2